MNPARSARRAWRFDLVGAVVALAVVLLSCANSNERVMQPKVPETTSAQTRGAVVQPPGTLQGEPGSLSTPPGARPDYLPTDNAGKASATTGYTDDQILQVLHATNLGERDAAQVAQERAKDPRVKLFAGMMLREHGDADTQTFELTKRLKLTLADSSLSTQLGNDAHVTTEQLRSLGSDADFDRMYIADQIKGHHDALDVIDHKLLSNAKSSEVREFLGTMRSKVESHLHEAESLQRSLDAK